MTTPAKADYRETLGIAARNLLKTAFARTGAQYSDELSRAAIGHVVGTYATDPEASRRLLSRVFDADRFSAHAYTEVPALVYGVEELMTLDPEFVITIYENTYARTVTSEDVTQVGGSAVFGLYSDKAQDYARAEFQLGHSFSHFLAKDLEGATTALIRTLAQYADRNVPDPTLLRAWTFAAGGRTLKLREDASYVWAWDPNSEHPSGPLVLLKHFVAWLRTAEPDQLLRATEQIFGLNEHAVLWSRLFMIAAERPGELGGLVWPLVTSQHTLMCSDLSKDAIDAIAAAYADVDREERRRFEVSALHFDFSDSFESEQTRLSFLERLFGTIGLSQLETSDARGFVEKTESSVPLENRRPLTITGGPIARARFDWLADQGLDVAEPSAAELLEATRRVEDALGWKNGMEPQVIEDAEAACRLLKELDAATIKARKAGVPEAVLRAPEGVLAGTCKLLLSRNETQAALNETVQFLQELTLRLTRAQYPVGSQAEETRFESDSAIGLPAARLEAVLALLLLIQHSSTPTGALVDRFQEMVLNDPHPVVRAKLAQHLGVLEPIMPDLMWRLANRVVEHEQNLGVLHALIRGVLARLCQIRPDDGERLLLTLESRMQQVKASNAGRKVQAPLASVATSIGGLAIYEDRRCSEQVLQRWLQKVAEHEAELVAALQGNRGALVEELPRQEAGQLAIRGRYRMFMKSVLESGTISLAAELRTAPNTQRVRAVHAVLSSAGLQLQIVSGALEGGRPGRETVVVHVEDKATFLSENATLLADLGSVGTPVAIYQLIRILNWLLEAGPETCFDLASEALLTKGHDLGVAAEATSAQDFVKLVGICLADHRQIFDDAIRRQKLIDCLDLFSSAGWSAARQLLYDIPELFR